MDLNFAVFRAPEITWRKEELINDIIYIPKEDSDETVCLERNQIKSECKIDTKNSLAKSYHILPYKLGPNRRKPAKQPISKTLDDDDIPDMDQDSPNVLKSLNFIPHPSNPKARPTFYSSFNNPTKIVPISSVDSSLKALLSVDRPSTLSKPSAKALSPRLFSEDNTAHPWDRVSEGSQSPNLTQATSLVFPPLSSKREPPDSQGFLTDDRADIGLPLHKGIRSGQKPGIKERRERARGIRSEEVEPQQLFLDSPPNFEEHKSALQREYNLMMKTKFSGPRRARIMPTSDLSKPLNSPAGPIFPSSTPSPLSSIPCLYIPPPPSSSPAPFSLALYFHAKGEDLYSARPFLSLISSLFKVHAVAVEYPGYGLYVDKETTCEKVLQDAERVVEYFTNRLGVFSSQILLFGRSIGSGPAVHLAVKYKVAALVLISPILSLRKAASEMVGGLASHFLRDRFNNEKAISQIRAPLLLFHGEEDTLIPSSHSQILFGRLC